MIRTREEANGKVAVGQIRSLLRWYPPWATRESDDFLDIADLQWFAAKGLNADLMYAPQVSRAFRSDREGNLCLAYELLPIPVCLVPISVTTICGRCYIASIPRW